MMIRTLSNTAMVLALALPASLALAADTPQTTPDTSAATTSISAPAATDPSATPEVDASTDAPASLQAIIREVRGIVQYRTADDQPWQKVEVGQSLDVGVEFRTGPRSSVTFYLPPDQLITLDRLGTLKLLQAVNNADRTQATTDLGMPYGRARYQVEGGQDVEHHATIRSPSATLAIRGTQDVTLTDRGFGRASASSRGTRVWFNSRGAGGQSKMVVFGSNDDKENQQVDEGDGSPGQHRQRTRIVDTGDSNARSQQERQMLSQFESYNGSQMNNLGVFNIQQQASPTAPPPSGGCTCYCEGGGSIGAGI